MKEFDIEIIPILKLLDNNTFRFILVETNNTHDLCEILIKTINSKFPFKKIQTINSSNISSELLLEKLLNSNSNIFVIENFETLLENTSTSLLLNQKRDTISSLNISIIGVIRFGNYPRLIREIPDLWSFRSYKTSIEVEEFKPSLQKEIEEKSKQIENTIYKTEFDTLNSLIKKLRNTSGDQLKRQLLIQIIELADELNLESEISSFEQELASLKLETKKEQLLDAHIKNPFTYGRIAENEAFINRVNELKRLGNNIINRINTIILAPRRYGKTSLIYHTIKSHEKNKNLKFCYLDLFTIRSKNEFLKSFANSIISSSSSKSSDIIRAAKSFLKTLTPTLSLGIDSEIELSFGIDDNQLNRNEREILEMPERIGESKNIHFVICIDEFQNISSFNDSRQLLGLFRSIAQTQRNVTYIFSGSQRHILNELFANPSQPFYRFGEIIVLDKMPEKEIQFYILASFKKSNKIISEKNANIIIQTSENHPYYVQQLSHLVWNRTNKMVTHKSLTNSIKDILDINNIFYETLFENLSANEVKFLISISRNIAEKKIRNQISSSSFYRVINSLDRKEILFKKNNEFAFEDPFFKLWIKNKSNTAANILYK